MTTRTFSDEESTSSDQLVKVDKSLTPGNHARIVKNLQNVNRSFTSPTQRRLDIEEHLSFLRHFHATIKTYSHNMFYLCFLGKLDNTHFTRKFDQYFSKTSRKKKQKQQCICSLSSIPEHTVYNCKNYTRWFQAHTEILTLCFECLESPLYSFEDFAHFAYKYSLPCSCHDIM
jgi:hypothetical protein